jgi:hypothetical protein
MDSNKTFNQEEKEKKKRKKKLYSKNELKD